MVFKEANVNIFIARPQVESILQDITLPQRGARWIFIYVKQLWVITAKQSLVQINIQCTSITLHLYGISLVAEKMPNPAENRNNPSPEKTCRRCCFQSG